MNPVQKVIRHFETLRFDQLVSTREGIDLLDSIFTEEDWADPAMRRWWLAETWRCWQRARNKHLPDSGARTMNTIGVRDGVVVQGYLEFDTATQEEFQRAIDMRCANAIAQKQAALQIYRYGTDVRGFHLVLPIEWSA